MKRTQELWNEQYKSHEQLKGQSALREFIGEDLTFDSRNKVLKQTQREWLDQQIQEKREKRQREKEEDWQEHLRTMELNNIRGILETRH